MAIKKITIVEEVFNSITHGLGLLLGIAGLVGYFLTPGKDRTVPHIIGFSIFIGSLMLMYLMSVLYHGLIFTKAKRVFLTIDYAMIFVLIAGTYTPFLLTALWGWIGWILLIFIWVLAITGIVIKAVFFYRFEKVVVGIYLLMGWMVMLAVKPLWSSVSMTTFTLLILGGLSYSIGTIFYIWRKLAFSHVIWHIFVIAGSAFHYFAVLGV